MAEENLEPTPAAPNGHGPDVRLLRSITLRNILSFGPDTPPLELRALNVLIGPNGSGKSNLLDAVELLRVSPDTDNLRAELKDDHWFWKGPPRAKIAFVRVHIGLAFVDTDVLHGLEIHEHGSADWLLSEDIQSGFTFGDTVYHSEDFESGKDGIKAKIAGISTDISPDEFNVKASALSQLRGRNQYPTLTLLTAAYRQIRLYREWTFGRNSVPRLPRRTDERNGFLAEDGSNLGLVLNKLRTYPEVKDQFISALNELYEGIRDFDVLVEGNTAQIFLREGNTSIPATRLSDGTLRYLCLLAILLHPTPPPLICLEEPELGLHPDAIVAVGKLIKEASTRTQLIITTHSRVLIDTFQDSPEDVVVVSKQDGSTRMERLDADKLRPYLDTYSLSNLWSSGDIGGNRWS